MRKGYNLQLAICSFYWWEGVLNIDLNVLCCNVDWNDKQVVITSILYLILCIGFYGCGLLGRFFKKIYLPSILISGLCMLYHNFYCIYPFEKAWSQVFI
jgi:hypothetical protein